MAGIGLFDSIASLVLGEDSSRPLPATAPARKIICGARYNREIPRAASGESSAARSFPVIAVKSAEPRRAALCVVVCRHEFSRLRAHSGYAERPTLSADWPDYRATDGSKNVAKDSAETVHRLPATAQGRLPAKRRSSARYKCV